MKVSKTWIVWAIRMFSPILMPASCVLVLGRVHSMPVNTKHLWNICTMLDQRRRRWANIVQMLNKCFVFAGMLPRVNPYSAEICLYKQWTPTCFLQIKFIINVLVSSVRFIWIPMLWVYGCCNSIILSVWGPSLDVRLWHKLQHTLMSQPGKHDTFTQDWFNAGPAS